jgi:hypothetical protein
MLISNINKDKKMGVINTPIFHLNQSRVIALLFQLRLKQLLHQHRQ